MARGSCTSATSPHPIIHLVETNRARGHTSVGCLGLSPRLTDWHVVIEFASLALAWWPCMSGGLSEGDVGDGSVVPRWEDPRPERSLVKGRGLSKKCKISGGQVHQIFKWLGNVKVQITTNVHSRGNIRVQVLPRSSLIRLRIFHRL